MTMPARERAVRCQELAQVLLERLRGAPDFHRRVYALVAELRLVGHDLWSFDESEDMQAWCPNYQTPSGPGICVTFVPDAVTVEWSPSEETSIRPEVQRFVDLGPFPSEEDLEEDDINRREAVLSNIARPVTRAEAAALLPCFGPDDAFGVAWGLLHLIETAPGAVVTTKPDDSANEWIQLLWDRWERAQQTRRR